MTPYAAVEDVFLAALDRATPEDRAAFVAAACAGDPDRLCRVGELLAAHDQSRGPLDDPPAAGTTAAFAPNRDHPGSTVGPYKLLQVIGEGGMGTVFLAEQTYPVQRRVALKVIRPGMDTKMVIARFEAERQALALMDHPNIARVLDAGETDQGRPYFVMELVKGVTITTYCDERRLTPRERLELFVPVCQAVQHAHQKGIIHRDIKPSNVLVAPYDGRPVVKVIDFGVAKATGQRLTEKTLFTNLGAVIGTLEYMSPEQAELNNQDVDTRSDIYSLGVLLYELLTGTTPLNHAQLKQAAFADMLRMIREEEPPKPSTRLSASTDTLPAISAQRQTEPAKLARLMRGELDWIVMKAINKDRARRYETANGFAADVERYLADEPVLACPPSVGYRLRKFTSRNSRGLVLASLVLVMLATLTGSIGWIVRDRIARQTETERVISDILREEDRLRSEEKWLEAWAVVKRAEGVLAQGGGSEKLRRAVQDRLKDLEMVQRLQEARLQARGELDGKFHDEVADAIYADAFRLFGLDLEQTESQEVAERISASSIRVQLVAALDDWAYTRKVLNAEGWQKRLAIARLADPEPWRNRLRNVLEGKDLTSVNDLIGLAHREELSTSTIVLLAKLATEPGNTKEMLNLFHQAWHRHPDDIWVNHGIIVYAIAMQPPRFEEAHRHSAALVALLPRSSAAHHVLGHVLSKNGDFDQAIAHYMTAIAIREDNYFAYNDLGAALGTKGRSEEAMSKIRMAIQLKEDFALAHVNLATVLADRDEIKGAITEARKAIDLQQGFPEAHLVLAHALVKKGDQNEMNEAIHACRRAIELKKNFFEAHRKLAEALRIKGQLTEAAAECRKALSIKEDPESHNILGMIVLEQDLSAEAIAEFQRAINLKNDPLYHYNLGNAFTAAQKFPDAVAAYHKAIGLWTEFEGKQLKRDIGRHASAFYNLGNAHYNQRKMPEAEAAFRKAIQLYPDHPKAYSNLGAALLEQGKHNEAEVALRKAIEITPNNANSYDVLGVLLGRQGKLEESLMAHRKAVEHSPKNANYLVNLGDTLDELEKYAEAEEAYRTAIKLKPDYADAFHGLGKNLQNQGKEVEAVAAYRNTIKLNPNDGSAYDSLGTALLATGKASEAIEAFRTAIKLAPDDFSPHYNLGKALWDQEKLAEAEASMRRATKLKPDYALAHFSLGEILLVQGRFQEGLAALKQGHRLGSTTPSWAIPAAQQVRVAERLVALDARLPLVLSGQTEPANPSEYIDLAQFARKHKTQYVAATELFAKAFSAEPKLAADLQGGFRYGAACAAAMGSCGQGKDADRLDEKERTRLRQQAQNWLRADLTARAQKGKVSQEVVKELARWQKDADLAGVRDEAMLVKLPAMEQAAWRQLWGDVAELLKRIEEPPLKGGTPSKKP